MLFFIWTMLFAYMLTASNHMLFIVCFLDIVISFFILLLFLITLEVLLFNHFLKLLDLFTVKLYSHLLCNSYQIRWNLVFYVIIHFFFIILIIILDRHFISAIIFILIILFLAFSNNSSNFSCDLIFIKPISLRVIFIIIHLSFISSVLISWFLFSVTRVYLFSSCYGFLDVKRDFIFIIIIFIVAKVLKLLIIIFGVLF